MKLSCDHQTHSSEPAISISLPAAAHQAFRCVELICVAECSRLGLKSCKVTMRVAYLLPKNLSHYVGPAGVWADMNGILKTGLQTMKVCPQFSALSSA